MTAAPLEPPVAAGQVAGTGWDGAVRSADPPPGHVPSAALDYCFGGAGDERTMAANVTALDRYALVPRVLPDGEVTLRAAVVGGQLEAPILVAPMSLQALLHPDAEAATAAAAARAGLGYCLSTFSSLPAAEVVARAGPGLRWFQLYILRDRQLTRDLVAQAEDLGFAAIVCTLDVPAVGQRSRDLSNSFDRFAAAPPALIRSRRFGELAASGGGTARSVLDQVFPNPECSWDDVAELVAATKLPVLLKGILHPGDARRAVAVGAAGVVVSNHGGRQFHRSVTSVAALPRVCEAVGETIPVYFDSGVRDPVHIAVALALGAQAVLLGRPVLAALASGGAERVTALLRDFAVQLTHVMRLAGAASPAGLRGIEAVTTCSCADPARRQRPGS
jgi:isopentenyl diphosphate isomerase/L-lactate dehydrogenase-like FMN-dependent dehydrogenase